MTARGCLAAVAMLCALLAACGGDEDADAGLPEFRPQPAATDTPSGLPTPTPSVSFGQANPVEAYRGFMQAVQIAMGTADPAYPGLTQYGQGGALKYWQGRAEELRRADRVILGPIGIRPALDEMLSSNKALLSDCWDDRRQQIYNRWSGEVVKGGADPPPIYLTAGMVRVNGVWKVDETFPGRGKDPCAR